MKTITAAFFLIFSLTSAVAGHGEIDTRLEAIYPFKQQLYDLCSGHGLMHLSDEEMRDLCDRLAKHLDDVRELQENPRHDIFLSNLSGLVIRSKIPEKVKHDLLRRSYEMSKEKSSEGKEWHFTIVRLIEEADVLSLDEVASHVDSKDLRLKGTSTRYLEKNSGREPKRPGRRAGEANPDAKAGVNGAVGPEGDSRNGTGSTGTWGYWIAGAFAIGILALLFMVRKGISPK